MDIARKLGVSHTAVSLGLRNSDRVSEALRERIRSVAEELNYIPDPMLQRLIEFRESKRTKGYVGTLAWINRWADTKAWKQNRDLRNYWNGAIAEAEHFGFRVEEYIVTPELTSQRLRVILETRQVSGLLIPPHPFSVSWEDFDLNWDNFAIVRVGSAAPETGPRSHSVGCDQKIGAELAVQRMAALGYRRVGFFTSPSSAGLPNIDLRMGYLRGLDLYDLPKLEPFNWTPGSLLSEKARLWDWISRWKPDAILTCSPELQEMLTEFNIRVPEEIGLACTSVSGSGDMTAGIDQKSLQVGRLGAELVVKLVQRRELGTPRVCRRILVECGWNEGGTLPDRSPAKNSGSVNIAA